MPSSMTGSLGTTGARRHHPIGYRAVAGRPTRRVGCIDDGWTAAPTATVTMIRRPTMKRTLAALTAAVAAPLLLAAAPAQAQPSDPGRPGTYLLTGDEGGSKFEGIGADERRG